HWSAEITCTGTCREYQYCCADRGEARAALLSWICRDTWSNSAVQAPSVKKGGNMIAQNNAMIKSNRIIPKQVRTQSTSEPPLISSRPTHRPHSSRRPHGPPLQ